MAEELKNVTEGRICKKPKTVAKQVRTAQKLKLASEDKSLWTAKDSKSHEEFETEPLRVLAPSLRSCGSCCYMKALQATDSERQV